MMPAKNPLLTKYRVICLGGFAIELAWLVWLWWHALPLQSRDAVCFKQAAYLGLHGDGFKVPTFAGTYPHVFEVCGYPSTFFTLANYAWFSLFGFNVYTCLAFDFTVHLAVVAMLGWGLSRVLDNPWLVALGMLGASHLLFPIGRPEELAVLLVLGAVAAIWGEQKRYALAIGLLGCCGTTAPLVAVGGVMLCFLFDLLRRPWRPATVARLAGLYALSLSVALIVYVAIIFPYMREAVEQVVVAWGKSPRQSVLENFSKNMLWGGRLVVATLVSLAGAFAAFRYRPRWPGEEPTWAAFVRANGIALPLMILIAVIFGRQTYDYRLIHLIAWAGLLVSANWAIRSWTSGAGKVAAYAFLVFMAVLPQQLPIRNLLMPMTWGDDAISYDQADTALHSVLPQNGSIGGDPELWTIATGGRPYYAFGWIGENYYPDYMVTCPSSSVSPLRADELHAKYTEVPTSLPRLEGKSTLRLGRFEFDVSKQRTDFCLRLWRKRPSQAAATQAGEGPSVSP